jgi:uncharacterized membrane protein
MTWFPSIPEWDGIHPALVHFPVALLLLVPVFLIISLFARQTWRGWATAALVVMALGTLASWMAVGSGHAAGQLVDKVAPLDRAIAGHESLAITTRNVFTWLTLAFAVLLLLPAILHKTPAPAVRYTVLAVLLVVSVGSTTLLANTASQGGRLVHVYGVQAMVVEPPPRAEEAAAVRAPAQPVPARPSATTTRPTDRGPMP